VIFLKEYIEVLLITQDYDTCEVCKCDELSIGTYKIEYGDIWTSGGLVVGL
jgi:hypothetical protein